MSMLQKKKNDGINNHASLIKERSLLEHVQKGIKLVLAQEEDKYKLEAVGERARRRKE